MYVCKDKDAFDILYNSKMIYMFIMKFLTILLCIIKYCLLKKLLNEVPFNIGADRWQIHPSVFA